MAPTRRTEVSNGPIVAFVPVKVDYSPYETAPNQNLTGAINKYRNSDHSGCQDADVQCP